ncbi:MAG: hypothetical protein GX781_03010 [Clostridiales bacterium]|nr:hypothetical protein [Clostridiales bacterium]
MDVPPRNHVFQAWTTVHAATCAEVGQQERTCKYCPKQELRESEKVGHKYSAWVQTEAATCIKPGQQERVCNICGFSETRETAKAAHAYSGFVVLSPATCTQEGQKEHICKNCGNKEVLNISIIHHKYGPWGNYTYLDCEKGGTRSRACTMCQFIEESEAKPRNHAFAKWITICKATCGQIGIQERDCRHCQLKEQREFPALKHWPGRWRVSIAAQLWKPGQQVKLCRRCGEIVAERSYNASKKRFAVNFCTLGIPLHEIIYSEEPSAQMLTPIDLGQKGTIYYPIVADNKYVVGLIGVTINDDEMILSYQFFDQRSEIIKPSIRFYADIKSVSQEAVMKRSTSIKFDQPFSKSKKFGDAAIVLLVMKCDAVYDANSKDNLKIDEDMYLLDGEIHYTQYMQNLSKLLDKMREE